MVATSPAPAAGWWWSACQPLSLRCSALALSSEEQQRLVPLAKELKALPHHPGFISDALPATAAAEGEAAAAAAGAPAALGGIGTVHCEWLTHGPACDGGFVVASW